MLLGTRKGIPCSVGSFCGPHIEAQAQLKGLEDSRVQKPRSHTTQDRAWENALKQFKSSP